MLGVDIKPAFAGERRMQSEAADIVRDSAA